MSVALILDGLLAAVLPLLAWRVLAARELFTSVVLFIALGLLISVAYVRLEARTWRSRRPRSGRA